MLVGCAADPSTDEEAAVPTEESVASAADALSESPYVCFFEHANSQGRYSCWNLGQYGVNVSSLPGWPSWCSWAGCLPNDAASSIQIVGRGRRVWVGGYQDANFGGVGFEWQNYGRTTFASDNLGFSQDRLSSFRAYVQQ
jgi:hypothetical protein